MATGVGPVRIHIGELPTSVAVTYNLLHREPTQTFLIVF